MVSLSFIRREILELERRGHEVVRYAIRPWPDTLVDDLDKAEQARTHYILSTGMFAVMVSLLRVMVTQPVQLCRALRLLCRVAGRSDRSVFRHLIYLAEATVLRQWTQRDRIEHLHVHFSSNPSEVAMYCHLLGGPGYSIVVHGPEEFDRAPSLGLNHKIHHARFVAAISHFCRSQLYRWSVHEDWPKIHIVRCGLDRKFLDHPFQPIDHACKQLFCIGRLCSDKGQLILIDAAEKLAQEGVDFELLLAGDGEMRPALENHIAEANLQGRVKILGWITSDEVVQRIVSARAVVLPSFAEGLPVVFMEACALSRPVISTYIAGHPELVRPGENGWLVSPGDVEALADAMRHTLSTPIDALTQMGQAGAKLVAEQHNIETEVAKLESLIESAIRNPSNAQ
jgi:glycosyltransferase involved in cell wall biosynthesis